MSEKIVVVTGAGRGIGQAICKRFAKDGNKIVAAARSSDQLEETKQIIEAEGGQCVTTVTDVASAGQVAGMIDYAVSEYGHVDVLVNNAGIAPNAPIEDFELDVFDAMIAVNVSGVFYACRAVWPIMKARSQGVIINISSLAAVDPFPGFAAYGASKAYVETLTKALAAEGKKHGIRVYSIGPGAVDTQMLRGPFPDFPDEQCLKPNDVAESVFLMTHPACQYAVGQTLYVSNI